MTVGCFVIDDEIAYTVDIPGPQRRRIQTQPWESLFITRLSAMGPLFRLSKIFAFTFLARVKNWICRPEKRSCTNSKYRFGFDSIVWDPDLNIIGESRYWKRREISDYSNQNCTLCHMSPVNRHWRFVHADARSYILKATCYKLHTDICYMLWNTCCKLHAKCYVLYYAKRFRAKFHRPKAI